MRQLAFTFLTALSFSIACWNNQAGEATEEKAKTTASESAPAKVINTSLNISVDEGQRLYKANCAACHGENAKGDGPAAIALRIRPREFRTEAFRYVSSSDGATDDDLARTIHFGRRNGQMPAFPNLMDEQVQSLTLYLRELKRESVVATLKEKFKDKPEITPEKIEQIARKQTKPSIPVEWTAPSDGFKADTAKGRTLFSNNCASCHGPEGRGDGLKTAVDSQGKRIKVRDLTQEKFRGGSDPLEIFWRIRCGIPGTPMPAATLKDDELWQIENFVEHIATKR